MSGNLGPQASTKGETTSKTTSKTGYDRLDINKLYKGKTAEPVAKAVTQKHGMQTLGKAPPARRAGASVVKSEPTSNDTNNSSVPPQQLHQQPPSSNLGQPIPQHQKWTNSTSRPPGPPSPMSVPNVPAPSQQPIHDKNWGGGPEVAGNYQSQRFAQEFPSLDAGEPTRGPLVNPNQQHLPSATGQQQTSSKSLDNQYGPGPILRPQTEGSWTQGGGRGTQRPPGPPAQNAPVREPGPERPNLGGPTPPPMSLGQGGPAPPPLGVYPIPYRGMPPFMYPNAGPPGPGYYPPVGPGMPRYGMPVPPGAPPPSGHRDPSDGPHRERDGNRGRGPPPPMRPTQQFAVKPIIRPEELKRMDDIDQDGSWASVRDDVDYNKRISFSDDEAEEKRDPSRKSSERKVDTDRQEIERDRKPVRILERQTSASERDQREHRYDHGNKEFGGNEQDNEEDWNKRRSNVPFDIKDRGGRRGRDSRDEDWRGGNNRFDDDMRNKKGPTSRIDPRGPQDFGNKQFSNLPPRLLRQQQQQGNPPQFQGNSRKTPSPVPGKDREREYQRDREWDRERTQPITQYRILERNRGDSESSNTSNRDKRPTNDYDSKSYEKEQTSRINSSELFKEKENESLKEKNEVGDNRTEIKRTDDSKSAFRSKSSFTSSWADEVDDDDYSKELDDMSKPSHMASIKPEASKTEEPKPKRVYIQQRKVENMTAPKSEPPPEPKQPKELPKQEKPVERPRPTAWGEREAREKSKSDAEHVSQNQVDDEREKSKEPSKSSEREIILSEKAQQLVQNNRDEHNAEKSDRRPQESERERPVRDFEKKDNRERSDRLDQDKSRDRYNQQNQKIDHRQDRDRGNNSNYNRDRPKTGRWGSNEFRRDNRTPDREFNTSSGRSSASFTDNSNASSAKASQENESKMERSKSGDVVKESSPGIEKEVTEKEKDHNDQKQKDYEKPRDIEKQRYRNDDNELDNRGNMKGSRNKDNRERVGHGVYQPRGGWGRPDGRGKGRGGRDHYDRPRRNEFDREKDERMSSKEDRDELPSKEKPIEKESGSSGNEEGRKEGNVSEDDRSRKDKEAGAGEPNKKSSRSPANNNKQNVRGGSRLQGYGPPSDKNPFSSSASTSKEDDTVKEKQPDQINKSNPPPTSGPVPLMELGDISPPNMPSRSRHHGARGRGGGMPPRMQESYSAYRGGNKRGRGDAKPLMSITSNELERNEWESGSESGLEEDLKKGQSAGAKLKKEGNKTYGAEKLRQNQNAVRSNATKDKASASSVSEQSNSANNQDLANNNQGKGALSGRGRTVNSDLDSYSSAIPGDVGGHTGSASDNSENVDGESYQSAQNKKNVPGKDKAAIGSNKNNSKQQQQQQTQQQQQQQQAANKERRIKNPPYEARPSTTKDIPPRFQKQQQGPQSQYSTSKSSDGPNTSQKESNVPTNAWEKSSATCTKSEHNSQPVAQTTTGAIAEGKDQIDGKLITSASSTAHASAGNTSTILESTGGPLKTMIFENRNYKSGTNVSKAATGSVKLNDTKKDTSLTSSLELPKDMALNFGKNVEDSPDLDFVPFDEQITSQPPTTQTTSSHSSTKPMPIGQPPRQYPSHQASPISPGAADLTEKIQSVKRVWDQPSMPSVAEQVVCGSDDNAFHGGFGSDSFKSSEQSNREFSSLQQPTSGYAPGSSPALAAISKPDSSTSPSSVNLRQELPSQIKAQQQSNMESHGGMSSSPFAYSMPQQHQGNAFGGMPAVPSPPAVMYGTSQTMHAAGPHTGVYQAFPHVEASQVMNSTGRSQYGQYSNPQGGGGGGPYGLNTNIFMTSIDAGYQPMSSFQHSHQQQHSQSGPQGQPPNQSNRISPGPMTTSGGGNSGGVIMNNSNMKPQGGSGAHPNMHHQQQVLTGSHNQQGYSQLSHHQGGAMSHHQHPVGPVGPAKQSGYSQSGLATQSQPQLFIPFDPNQQSVINLGQNFMSSGIRSAPPGGPPPPATPPVQALQSSAYYSSNTGSQVYHTGSNQAGNLQQLHVAVTPNPQALQNLQTATQHFGLQFQSPLNLQGYNQQAATTVSALNLGGQLIRQSGHPGHSHYSMKQPGIDLVQQSQMKSHDTMMNQTWNTQGFSLNQGFHGGNKPGGNADRNSGNNIGNQRKGNHQIGNMGGMGAMKYMSNSGGYPSQKGGRFSTPGPIQRPVSTSPSTGPPGSMNPPVSSGVSHSQHSGHIGVGPGVVGGTKPKHLPNDSLNKHMIHTNSGVEEGLLDKFMTEAGHRSITGTPDPSKVMISSSSNGSDNSSLKNPNLTMAPANKSPINFSEK